MNALAELIKLPLAERLQLVEDLWDSIAEEHHALPDSPELVAELQSRYADYLADPSSAIPCDLALEQIRSGRE